MPAKRYVAELSDDGIDLQEVVASYTETVERREEALKRVRAMEDELNALLPRSFRPRPG